MLNCYWLDFVKFDLSNKLHHIRLLRKVKLISPLLMGNFSFVIVITRLITSTFVNESPFSEAVEVKLFRASGNEVLNNWRRSINFSNEVRLMR
ncbi:MAG: hypothetical protein ACTS5R_00785 [Candidatus Hodgkinia cicadicola]